MSPLRALLPTIVAVTAVACSRSGHEQDAATPDEQPGYLTAATLGEQVVLPTADYLRLARYREADVEYGRNLALQCRTCHNLDDRASSPLGPSLYGLFGRRAGSLGDFSYSPAMQAADFVWTPRALDAWIAAPWRFVPGNRMSFVGLSDQDARDALIAALLQITEGATDQNGKEEESAGGG